MKEWIRTSNFIKYIKQLLNTGCGKDLHFLDRQPIQMINGTALIRFIGGLLFIIYSIFQGKSLAWSSNIPNILSTFLILLTLFFNQKRKYLIAGVWGNLMLSVPVFINLWFYFGPYSGSYFFFILFSLIPIVTIPVKNKILIISLSVINILFFFLIRDHNPVYGIPSGFTDFDLLLYQDISILATLLLILTAFLVFQRMLHQNEKLLEEKSQRLHELVETANTQATIDTLTGLINRRKIEEILQTEILRSTRYGTPLTLIMFDLDHFKRVNDTLGHDLGDKVLIKTGELVSSILRTVDVLGRWGGEEFLIIMPHTTQEGALLVAEKCRKHLEDYWHDQAGIVTASFGVAEWMQGEDIDSFVKRVDNAMYRAKEGGRNLVSISMEQVDRSHLIASLEWVPTWETGNTVIDAGHKQVIDTVNKTMHIASNPVTYPQVLSLVKDLCQFLSEYFQYEEDFMAKCNYPSINAHRQEHQNILEQICRMTTENQHLVINPLSLNVFITNELVVGHFINYDLDFVPYIEKNNKIARQLTLDI